MAVKKSAGAKPASGTRAAKKTPAKSATAKRPTAKSAPKKTAATKTATTKSVTTKTATAKAAVTRTAPTRTAPTKTAGRAKSVPAVNGIAKKAAAKKPVTKVAAKPVAKTTLASPPKKVAAKAKTPFTKVELREFGKLIDGQLRELQAEYDAAMIALDDLQHNRLDTAGDDPADAGNKTFEREQEMSIANNRMHLITQLQRARARVDEGSYGLCENCGKTIPKARLQAYPSATLCVDCKAREERR